MDVKLTREEKLFQAQVQSFLAEHWEPSGNLMPGPRLTRATQRFIQALAAHHWLAGQWPVSVGGAAWSDRQRLLYEQAAASACAPQAPYHGTDILGPLLMRAGSAQQLAVHLPGIASGEVRWCQALAEDSGALDLELITTRAVRLPDQSGWRLFGHKPWVLDMLPAAGSGTSNSPRCWLYLLARTETEPSPVRAVGVDNAEFSLFLLPAEASGLTAKSRPMIGEPAGQHAVHELVLDGVQLPNDALVGDPGSGARWAAEIERAELTRPGRVARTAVSLEQLRKYVESTTTVAGSASSAGEPLREDPDFMARLHALEVELASLLALEARAWDAAKSRPDPHRQEALRLGLASRIEPLTQQIADLQIDALGYFALPFVDFSALDNEGPIGPEFAQPALLGMLSGSARAAIGAPREHLKNIIAKSVLALPETGRGDS